MRQFYVSLSQDTQNVSSLVTSLMNETGIEIIDNSFVNVYVKFDEYIGLLLYTTNQGAIVMTDKYIILPVEHYTKIHMYEGTESIQ